MFGGVEIKVGYNPINERNTFTCGDRLSGEVELASATKCTVQSLIVKLKGKGVVGWYNGDDTALAGEEYFSIKQEIIHESKGNNVIDQGCHVYPFTFQIPAEDLPPSFRGSYGKIKYSVEAVLSRSMRMDSKAKTEFTLIQNGNLNSDPIMMAPQQQAIEKKGMVFTSGSVGMHVNIARTGFYQGEDIQVVASIQNRSSREVKPKFCLYRECRYFAGDDFNFERKSILKEVGDPIPPSASQTVTRTITIPPDTSVSILNSYVLKVEYKLQVSLDVKYAIDPKLMFPITILPALPESDEEQRPAYPAYGFLAFANSDMPGENSFLHVLRSTGRSTPPPPYGTYDMYPSLANFDGKS
ncbi:arrestin domain-containing protein 3-like isoform X2 [Cheilinus undulatus]|uniref:arrestin domain-containing protein 3-like isoform X2 n=1 Tax=Cheilinus undulatus TaxID=241271 RepID=UPI001BD63975|nr:arrestin domain-containing protein 3-like isoform X2 [Cheilinus undulatus]